MPRHRRGFKYNVEIFFPDNTNHTYKDVTLSEGLTWCGKVITYFKSCAQDKDDIVIRFTKKAVVYRYKSPLITLQDEEEHHTGK